MVGQPLADRWNARNCARIRPLHAVQVGAQKGKLVWCAVPPEGDIVPATTEVDARARRQLRDESAGGGVEGVGCADGDAEWNTAQLLAVRDDIVAREVSHVVERAGRTICGLRPQCRAVDSDGRAVRAADPLS